MKYPNKCCRCGFCCLHEQCPISLQIHGRAEICPALLFDGDVAVCLLAGLVPIGDGCCIKARAFKDGVQYDFASLPAEVKIREAQKLKEKCYADK